MDFQQLEVFLSVAETNSFSETGRLLHRSQSSVTRTIKQLEVELDTQLFYRTTHNVELTNSGKMLVPFAEEMLHLQDKLKRNIASLKKSISGPLRLGASLTLADIILPDLLEKFRDLYPQVQLQITIDTSQQVIHLLQNRDVHFALTEADIHASAIISEPFMEDELVVIVSPTSEWAALEAMTIKKLATLPLIMREKGSGIRNLLYSLLEKENVEPEQLTIVMELNSTETIKRMVMNGLGCAVLSRAYVEREIEMGLLKPLSFSPVPFKRHFYFSYREGGPLSPSVEAMIDLLREMYIGQE